MGKRITRGRLGSPLCRILTPWIALPNQNLLENSLAPFFALFNTLSLFAEVFKYFETPRQEKDALAYGFAFLIAEVGR